MIYHKYPVLTFKVLLEIKHINLGSLPTTRDIFEVVFWLRVGEGLSKARPTEYSYMFLLTLHILLGQKMKLLSSSMDQLIGHSVAAHTECKHSTLDGFVQWEFEENLFKRDGCTLEMLREKDRIYTNEK